MVKAKKSVDEDFLSDGFNKIFEHRSRLAICVLLTKNKKLSFKRLKELLSETDGNLGAQLKKLEQVEYIDFDKEFVDRKPVTWYAITKEGRKQLKIHLKALQELIGGVV